MATTKQPRTEPRIVVVMLTVEADENVEQLLQTAFNDPQPTVWNSPKEFLLGVATVGLPGCDIAVIPVGFN